MILDEAQLVAWQLAMMDRGIQIYRRPMGMGSDLSRGPQNQHQLSAYKRIDLDGPQYYVASAQ